MLSLPFVLASAKTQSLAASESYSLTIWLNSDGAAHNTRSHMQDVAQEWQCKQSKLFVCWFAAKTMKKKENDKYERLDYDVHTARIIFALKTWNYLLVSWFCKDLLLHTLKHLCIDILILTIGYYCAHCVRTDASVQLSSAKDSRGERSGGSALIGYSLFLAPWSVCDSARYLAC